MDITDPSMLAAPTATPAPTPTNIPGTYSIPDVVYHTETGSRFHLMPDCGLTVGADPDTWEHSVEAGYNPCPDCVGKEYPEAVEALKNGELVVSASNAAQYFVPNTPTPEPGVDDGSQLGFVPLATASDAAATETPRVRTGHGHARRQCDPAA